MQDSLYDSFLRSFSLAHAVAVSDGEHTITLGMNGKRVETEAAPDDLAEEASAYLAAVNKSRSKRGGKAQEIDPSVRQALEALGYLHE